jgi:hypothetical protein
MQTSGVTGAKDTIRKTLRLSPAPRRSRKHLCLLHGRPIRGWAGSRAARPPSKVKARGNHGEREEHPEEREQEAEEEHGQEEVSPTCFDGWASSAWRLPVAPENTQSVTRRDSPSPSLMLPPARSDDASHLLPGKRRLCMRVSFPGPGAQGIITWNHSL